MSKKIFSSEIILEAALEVASKSGIEAISMRSLAEKVGCSVMPIYDTFYSKVGLLEALSQYAYEKTFKEIPKANYIDRCILMLDFGLRFPKFYLDLLRLNQKDETDFSHVENLIPIMQNIPRLRKLSSEELNKINALIDMFIIGLVYWESGNGFIGIERRATLKEFLIEYVNNIIYSYTK